MQNTIQLVEENIENVKRRIFDTVQDHKNSKILDWVIVNTHTELCIRLKELNEILQSLKNENV